MLSFLLPGLGQLYQGRRAAMLVCFAVFCASLVVEPARYALPLWSLLAAAEAMRAPRDDVRGVSGARRMAFASVGILGFLCWFGFFAALVHPMRQVVERNDVSLKHR